MEYLLLEILLFLSIHILCIYPYIFCICPFLSLIHVRVYAHTPVPYIYIIYACMEEPIETFSRFSRLIPQNTLIFAKNTVIDFQWVTKKVHFFVHFFAKIFGQFKKKQYLCTRFWETSVFRFSTGGPDIKIQIHLRGPNFFAPNRTERRKQLKDWYN